MLLHMSVDHLFLFLSSVLLDVDSIVRLAIQKLKKD